jgi:RNA polymerase II-associated protein 2
VKLHPSDALQALSIHLTDAGVCMRGMTSFLDYLNGEDPSTLDNNNVIPVNDQQKSTALRYAGNIQYQKRMKEKVLDLILNVVDLPSSPDADPARPSPSDAALFKKAHRLFQAQDFNDVILERNIYEKCGYGLCPRPYLKSNESARNRPLRSAKETGRLRMSAKELEKWCSFDCAERGLFIRLQLGTEPVWLRDTPIEDVKLLEESRQVEMADGLASNMQGLELETSAHVGLSDSLQRLAIDQGRKNVIEDRMKSLALERGKENDTGIAGQLVLGVRENDIKKEPVAPQKLSDGEATVEGYRTRNVQLGRDTDHYRSIS